MVLFSVQVLRSEQRHRLARRQGFPKRYCSVLPPILILAIYAPMIYTAQYVMILVRADPLRGQVEGGWALVIETFLGPVK